MGLISTNFIELSTEGVLLSSYWSPNKVAVVLGGSIFGFFILLLPFIFLSSWVLARKKGLIISFVLLITPGLLSLCHLLPVIQ
jgi:ABC-type transport system involved in multi-copper enzyme maturation permease subunit